MKYFVMSVLDTAARAFAQPFYAPAEQVAIRSVRDMVQDPERSNQLAKHPEDFELYNLGLFDDNSGTLEPCEARLVCRCKDLVRSTN